MHRVESTRKANVTVCLGPLFDVVRPLDVRIWLQHLCQQGVTVVHAFHLDDNRHAFPYNACPRVFHHVRTSTRRPPHKFAGPYFEQNAWYAHW